MTNGRRSKTTEVKDFNRKRSEHSKQQQHRFSCRFQIANLYSKGPSTTRIVQYKTRNEKKRPCLTSNMNCSTPSKGYWQQTHWCHPLCICSSSHWKHDCSKAKLCPHQSEVRTWFSVNINLTGRLIIKGEILRESIHSCSFRSLSVTGRKNYAKNLIQHSVAQIVKCFFPSASTHWPQTHIDNSAINWFTPDFSFDITSPMFT